MEQTKKFNWGYFIIGVLFLMSSVVAFRNPGSSLSIVILLFGISALTKGVFELFFRNQMKKITGYKGIGSIIIGIFDILLGILLLCNMGLSLFLLPFVFAGWFIIDSIWNLVLSYQFKEVSKAYYWFSMVLSILGIILGFVLLLNPLTSVFSLVFLIGCYFMVTGINFIVLSF